MVEISELLKEARDRTNLLRKSLPSEIDPVSLSRVKLSFKPLAYRETLIWRTEELARCACDLYERGDLGAAVVLTRAVTECAAACWYVMVQVRDFSPEAYSSLNLTFDRLALGARNNPDMPKPIHVGDMIREVDEKIPGFKDRYGDLSEFTHPNWSATTLLYSLINEETKMMSFGSNPRASNWPATLGLKALTGSLGIFEYAYNQIADLMPIYVEACEKAIPAEL